MKEDGIFVANHPGEGNINLIPNGYDWEKAMEFTITVVE
jgi:hypothetical protein